MAFAKTASQIKGRGADEMGRWHCVLLEAEEGKDILIIGICQSCDTTNNGINTFHTQHKMSLSIENRTDVHPRRIFAKNLEAFMKSEMDTNPDTQHIMLGD